MDYMPTCIAASKCQQRIYIGDESGCMFVISAYTFETMSSFKSLGGSISRIDSGLSGDLVYAYENKVSVFDSNFKPV